MSAGTKEGVFLLRKWNGLLSTVHWVNPKLYTSFLVYDDNSLISSISPAYVYTWHSTPPHHHHHNLPSSLINRIHCARNVYQEQSPEKVADPARPIHKRHCKLSPVFIGLGHANMLCFRVRKCLSSYLAPMVLSFAHLTKELETRIVYI